VSLLILALSAAVINVSLELELHDVTTPQVTVVLKRLGTSDEAVRKALRRDSALPVALTPGQWQLDIDAPDLWHQTQFLLVGDTAPPLLAVSVWPRATIVASISTDAPSAPTEMFVRFEGATAGQTRCAIEKGQMLCAMPAGTYRMRMKPKGFIAQTFSDLTLAPGQTRDLGSLAFHRGQSISGRVQPPARFKGDLTAVRVVATPAGATLAPPLTAQADKNGFFQIDGVAPGAYRVGAALQRTLASPTIDVLVRAGSEAELLAPLALARPLKIEALIAPAAAPDGAPWHVKLFRRNDRRLDEITESNASPSGVWISPPLSPSLYDIEVGTIGGDEWHTETINLDTDQRLSVLLTQRQLTGRVLLGDHALPATLTLSGKSFSTSATADENGRFRALLPKTDDRELTVIVRSKDPWLQRKTRVKRDEESLDIVLPDSLIVGEVVDSSGAPVANALLSIVGNDLADGLLQPSSRADGKFEVHGLAPGKYTITASDFLKESEPLSVEVSEGATLDPIRLVVRDVKQIRGRVISALGPIPGARVQARATDVAQMITHNRQTDADGVFAAAVSPGAQAFEMTVAPPGFAFIIAGGSVTDRPMLVRAEQNGGTLTVARGKDDVAYLVHNGGTCPDVAVTREWPSSEKTLDDGTRQLMLPMMEPGVYRACVVAPREHFAFRASGGAAGGRCVSAILPPFGSATLDLRSR
jgi:hypothetical protein